jgi:hypothetical protein
MDLRHPYEQLPLFTAGICLAVWLIASHLLMLVKPLQVQGYLKKFPRDPLAGQILLALGMAWFWLLVAPDGLGMLSELQMDLGEFNKHKPWLRLLVPVAVFVIAMSVRDFLARATRADVGGTTFGIRIFKRSRKSAIGSNFHLRHADRFALHGGHAVFVPGLGHMGGRKARKMERVCHSRPALRDRYFDLRLVILAGILTRVSKPVRQKLSRFQERISRQFFLNSHPANECHGRDRPWCYMRRGRKWR